MNRTLKFCKLKIHKIILVKVKRCSIVNLPGHANKYNAKMVIVRNNAHVGIVKLKQK